jgi:hypothetical protein
MMLDQDWFRYVQHRHQRPYRDDLKAVASAGGQTARTISFRARTWSKGAGRPPQQRSLRSSDGRPATPA